MPKQYQPLEFNTFVKGIITQASPLTFPDNASIDEDNFVLNRDGSRDRRLGMDFETGYKEVVTGVTMDSPNVAISTFNWKNPGGDASSELIVVQVGNELRFFNVQLTPVSDNQVGAFSGVAQQNVRCSYAVVDGYLVVATGAKAISVFDYDNGVVTRQEQHLFIRDTFGIDDIDPTTGQDLRAGNNISTRPSALSNPHLYNLRNQGWMENRQNKWLGMEDPIYAFWSATENPTRLYPSNADYVSIALMARGDIEEDPILERFFPGNLLQNPIGSTAAAKGHFIIDALDRGTSRYAAVQKAEGENITRYTIQALPQDSTPGGASLVAGYAGRIFFSGFNGEVVGGDSKSPKLSSFVMFSQLVSDISDISKCYAKGDPTSRLESDPLETDGGTIRIDGAFNIRALIPISEFLFVVAENGVWRIRGGSDYGFTATNYAVDKLTEIGAINQSSIVTVENMFFFWSKDGIYHCAPNQFGDYEVVNISKNMISQLYEGILFEDKVASVGRFDSFGRTVRWVYQNRISRLEDKTKELVFDLELTAFYISTIGSVSAGLPKVIAPVEVPPFFESALDIAVTASGEVVTASGAEVTVFEKVRSGDQRETLYMVVTGVNPIKYSFAAYRDPTFTDWKSYDGVGVDAPAYMVTGYFTGGDSSRAKQTPYVFFHLRKTESGVNSDGEPINPSSCIVQAQWDWGNSAAGGKWGVPFQAYRHKRMWMPESLPNSGFDNGFATVVSKNKLRGRGKALSLRISTEPAKDCRLLGWSLLIGVNDSV